MRNNTVEIIDKKGQKLRLHISVTSFLGRAKDILGGYREDSKVSLTGANGGGGLIFKAQSPGNWKVLDFGLIHYNAGIVLSDGDHAKGFTSNTIYLINIERTWGMKLFNYYDGVGVNDAGEGTVPLTWVTGLSEGRFSWSIVD